jgi:hypothetical protein
MNDQLPAVNPPQELDNRIGSRSVEGFRVTCSQMHGRAIIQADRQTRRALPSNYHLLMRCWGDPFAAACRGMGRSMAGVGQ